jgi:hypothetical protein
MIKPTVHLNGTSRETLTAEYLAALRAVQAALVAVRAITVNGRDYYPQGPTVFYAAEDEHCARLQRLETTEAELTEILIDLTHGAPLRARQALDF